MLIERIFDYALMYLGLVVVFMFGMLLTMGEYTIVNACSDSFALTFSVMMTDIIYHVMKWALQEDEES